MRKPLKPANQEGFSLIEVLVALVIFAFGMLGAAGLQLATLKSNKFAASSSGAISLAREYGELMQTFPSAVITTSSGVSTFFIDTNTSFASPNPSLCTGNLATCTTAQLAQASIEDWANRVKLALPGGRAEVCRTSEPRNASGDLQWGGCDNIGDLVVVKMGWIAKNDKGETLFDTDRPKMLLPLLGNLRDFSAP
jgi:type IV pilus assembly protein PilV